MGYETALNKSWEVLEKSKNKIKRIKFLNNEYSVNLLQKKISPFSNNIDLKDHSKILILHYLANEGKISEIKEDKWISFKELEGGEIYYPSFRKRAVDPILKKYGDNPTAIFKKMNQLNGEKIDNGSAAISIIAFPKVTVGVILWEKDDEFEAECNMLFNQSIKNILLTEDIAVLGGIIASLI